MKEDEKGVKRFDKQSLDYTKPVAEIDYDTKRRGKRRRGDVVIDEFPKKKMEPYKRDRHNLLLEEDTYLNEIYEEEQYLEYLVQKRLDKEPRDE